MTHVWYKPEVQGPALSYHMLTLAGAPYVGGHRSRCSRRSQAARRAQRTLTRSHRVARAADSIVRHTPAPEPPAPTCLIPAGPYCRPPHRMSPGTQFTSQSRAGRVQELPQRPRVLPAAHDALQPLQGQRRQVGQRVGGGHEQAVVGVWGKRRGQKGAGRARGVEAGRNGRGGTRVRMGVVMIVLSAWGRWNDLVVQI